MKRIIASLAIATGLALSLGTAAHAVSGPPLPAPSSSSSVAVCHLTRAPGAHYVRSFVPVTAFLTGYTPGRYDIVPSFDHETGPTHPAWAYFGHRWDWEFMNGRWVHGPAQRFWLNGCHN